MPDDIYCYPPNFNVLKNKLDIQSKEQLELLERLHARYRIEQGCPSGDFDLNHLKAIHGHIFQDVYEWAGETRLLEINKGSSQFMPVRFIETGMQDVHKRIAENDYFKGSNIEEFGQEAGKIIGDVNHIHPFREGNGRTQLQYLEQLAETAGHELDITQIPKTLWIEASIQSHDGNYAMMQQCISNACERQEIPLLEPKITIEIEQEI